jgi:hypothetical protein
MARSSIRLYETLLLLLGSNFVAAAEGIMKQRTKVAAQHRIDLFTAVDQSHDLKDVNASITDVDCLESVDSEHKSCTKATD